MRNRNSTRQRRSAAAFAGTLTLTLTLTLALAMAWSAGSAFAQDDEEDVPLDTKLIRQFLKDLGLRKDGESIEYRERAPLVVPPSRNLPPPQSETAAASNPAWPKDPDVKQRKLDAAKKKQPNKSAAEVAEAEARPLPRDQLERGRSSTPASGTVTKDVDAEAARPLRPNELGSKSLWSTMFAPPWSDKTETGTFTGEPPRDNLTAPPTGYQTPSPNQPYGLAPKDERGKATTLEQRTSGETR
jgi:hypothetical protein